MRILAVVELIILLSVANVNQGELWNHIFVLLDRKEKRERSSRGNGCFEKNGKKVDNKK